MVGISRLASTAMMATTTIISIRVKAWRGIVVGYPPAPGGVEGCITTETTKPGCAAPVHTPGPLYRLAAPRRPASVGGDAARQHRSDVGPRTPGMGGGLPRPGGGPHHPDRAQGRHPRARRRVVH